jgi:hypothetical protein
MNGSCSSPARRVYGSRAKANEPFANWRKVQRMIGLSMHGPLTSTPGRTRAQRAAPIGRHPRDQGGSDERLLEFGSAGRPKGTPHDIMKFNGVIRSALADTAVKQRLNELGQIAPSSEQTPQALAAYHKAEIEKWWPIIKAANIKAE